MVNATNKTYKPKRGSVLGTMSVVDDRDIKTISEMTKKSMKDLPQKADFSGTIVPKKHRRNADVFAAHENDFGRTDTVKMKIDIQGASPIHCSITMLRFVGRFS